MNYPEIRFRDSFLLINAIRADIELAYKPPLAQSDESEKLSRDYINKKLDLFETAWRPYEAKLVQSMCIMLNMEFRQNIIDIYAAPFYTSFSFPLVIATKYDPDRAIEVIIHELVHVLLYDNKAGKLNLSKQSEEWRKLFEGIDDEVALIHIPVHAILQALFDDILHEPERTARDKKLCETYPPYKLAWEYVEKVGYKNVIEQIKHTSH